MYVFFFLIVVTMGGGGPESRVVESFAEPKTCEQAGQAMSQNRELMEGQKVLDIRCEPVQINLS